MSSLQQNWRSGQNRFCLEVRRLYGEREGVGEVVGDREEKWYNVCTYE
jgi:hypothetical protein